MMSAEGHWYGGGAAVDSGFVTLSKSGSPQAGRQGTATSMSLYAGCYTGTCTFDQNTIDELQLQLQLLGSRVTIEDTLPPDLTAVQAGGGLLAPGLRSGDEPVTFRGTLKAADGQPVGGADVRILVREARLGAPYVDRGGVTTGLNGRFVFSVPAGSSRVLRLAYRAYLGDDAYTTRSTSTLNTRARISVRDPKRVRRRGVAKFSGRLVGRPFPPRGMTVDLQIFRPGVGWRVFANARTRKSGTLTVRYHFQRASRGRFTFRIRLRPNDAYPYSRGVSRRVRVRVG
jgi:hypothetical protein